VRVGWRQRTARLASVLTKAPFTFHPLLSFSAVLPQDASLLLSKGAPEAHREAAALREAQVALRLEAGRLGRAERMMRQKVGRGHASLIVT
jgi:hypothetical protein